MKSKLNVALAVAAGLLGGLLTRYIEPSPAAAQDQSPSVREIRAESFVLVDPGGRTVGTFSSEPFAGPRSRIISRNPDAPLVMTQAPRRIVLRDSSGREIWSAGGTGLVPLSAR
ncbi:MAG: hypothetical protein ABUS49_12555 [Acidobacteriota bacterium]